MKPKQESPEQFAFRICDEFRKLIEEQVSIDAGYWLAEQIEGLSPALALLLGLRLGQHCSARGYSPIHSINRAILLDPQATGKD